MLTELLFPSRCALCRAPLTQEAEDGLCPDCRSLMQRDRERRLHRCLPYVDVICASEYQGAMRGALLRAKEGGARSVALPMAKLLYAAYQHQNPVFEPDLVTFVPSSAMRVHRRGFLLTQELAQYMAQKLEIPCQPLLQHTLLSARQAGMRAEKRREHAESSLSMRRSVDVHGQRILLVDDIVASGSTMNCAARLLYEAGASEIVGLALAKSEKNR